MFDCKIWIHLFHLRPGAPYWILMSFLIAEFRLSSFILREHHFNAFQPSFWWNVSAQRNHFKSFTFGKAAFLYTCASCLDWAIILGRNKRRLIENYFRFWRHIPNKHRDRVFRRSSISCHDIVWKSDRFGRWIRRRNLHRILQKAFDDYYDVQQPFYSFFSSWEK